MAAQAGETVRAWAGYSRLVSRTGAGALVAAVGLVTAYRPSPEAFALAALLALAGATIRFWSAGIIAKNRELATSGPYAFVRNPLYLGSLLISLAFLLLNGNPWFALPAAVLWVVIYVRTVRAEEAVLAERFGQAFADYRARVPAIIPWRGRCRVPGAETAYSLDQSIRNKEYNGALGTLGMLALFYVYMHWADPVAFRATTGVLVAVVLGVRTVLVARRERARLAEKTRAAEAAARSEPGDPGDAGA